MLYDPSKFEPLTEREWDEAWVRDRIAALVADADGAYDPETLWPADEWDAWTSPTPLKNLYVGAAGMIWALDRLRRQGLAESTLDLAAAAERALELWRAEPDYPRDIELPQPARSSLLNGEAGILLVLWRLSPNDTTADELASRISENVENDANELMWGSPGTMLAALAMHSWTGEERWLRIWQESADALWRRRDENGLWTQRLYGDEVKSLGAPHGLVGNVRALLNGPLDANRRLAVARETNAVLARNAHRDGDLLSWPLADGRPMESRDGEVRLQWCGGAPGVLIAAWDYLDEELLYGAARTVVEAGAHGDEKGAGICHGTAGNGYALLKAYERDDDHTFLPHAQRFAVHALEQAERLPARYSLWTGGIGAAVFAADCIAGRARYPALDGFD